MRSNQYYENQAFEFNSCSVKVQQLLQQSCVHRDYHCYSRFSAPLVAFLSTLHYNMAQISGSLRKDYAFTESSLTNRSWTFDISLLNVSLCIHCPVLINSYQRHYNYEKSSYSNPTEKISTSGFRVCKQHVLHWRTKQRFHLQERLQDKFLNQLIFSWSQTGHHTLPEAERVEHHKQMDNAQMDTHRAFFVKWSKYYRGIS